MNTTDGESSPGGFEVDFCNKPIRVTYPPDVKIDKATLENWPHFKQWKATLEENLTLQHTEWDHAFHDDPYELQSIDILSVYWAGSQPVSMSLNPTIKSTKGARTLPAVTYLRGGNIAVLIIIRPKDIRDEKLVIMTERARVPAGSLAFWEIPAGMVNEEQIFDGTVAKEIAEATGLVIHMAEVIDMTELALRNSRLPEKNLMSAIYPSPGGSDEYIVIFLWEKEFAGVEIDDLRGRLTGKRAQGEIISLRLVDYDDLWREGARDVKTLAAWTLYEGLSREGILQEITAKRKMARELIDQEVEW